MSSQVGIVSSSSSPATVSIMASSSVDRVRFQAKTSAPAAAKAFAKEPPIRPRLTTPQRPGTKVGDGFRSFSSAIYASSICAVTASRMSAMRRMASANWLGVSACAPSDHAWEGQSWTSISRASAPAAVAA